LNVTFPVAAGRPSVSTVAVSVTLSPKVDGEGEVVKVMLVGAGLWAKAKPAMPGANMLVQAMAADMTSAPARRVMALSDAKRHSFGASVAPAI
jgi:hypothetical protein